MSVAEMKEMIIKSVVTSDNAEFLTELVEFIHEKTIDTQLQTPARSNDLDEFYERLTSQYGDVMQKLAQ